MAELSKTSKEFYLTKGWLVDGVFWHQSHFHGLVYNPHTNYWFHVWWDAQGQCLTLNCDGEAWQLRPSLSSQLACADVA